MTAGEARDVPADSTAADQAAVASAAEVLGPAATVTVLTGAGISTESGIPDFRGPQGVWTRNPQAQRLFTLQDYLADPEVRREAWQRRLAHEAWTAAPNRGHQALVRLEAAGRLRGIITQNIDGLHQAAGSSPDRVFEVHGSLASTECLGCGDRRPMAEALDRVRAGEPDPACLVCGGIVKSATVAFGQPLPEDVWQRSLEATVLADAFVAVGSTLQVYPVASLVDLALHVGLPVVVVNGDPTPYDDEVVAAGGAVVRGRIGTVLPDLVDRLVG